MQQKHQIQSDSRGNIMPERRLKLIRQSIKFSRTEGYFKIQFPQLQGKV